MSQPRPRRPATDPGLRPWWAEVQHLRAAAERRQAQERLLTRGERRQARSQRTAASRGDVSAGTSERAPTASRVRPGSSPPRVGPRDRSRPPRRPLRLVDDRPDRIAMWIPMMGFVLLLVAAVSSMGPH